MCKNGEVVLWLIKLFDRRPDIAGLFGMACFLLFSLLGFRACRDYRKLSAAPHSMTLAEACLSLTSEERWVSLQEVLWHCDRSLHSPSGDSMSVVVSDLSEGHFVVARYEDPLDCALLQEKPLQGVLRPMSERGRQKYIEEGLLLPSEGAIGLLCTYCGRGNSLTGIVVCTLLALIGLALYPMFHWRHQKWSEVSAAPEPAPSPQPKSLEVRLLGLFFLLGGGALVCFGRDQVINGLLPAPWLGLFIIAVGLVFLVAPQSRFATSRAARLDPTYKRKPDKDL